jgi:hypothetical protein
VQLTSSLNPALTSLHNRNEQLTATHPKKVICDAITIVSSRAFDWTSLGYG